MRCRESPNAVIEKAQASPDVSQVEKMVNEARNAAWTQTEAVGEGREYRAEFDGKVGFSPGAGWIARAWELGRSRLTKGTTIMKNSIFVIKPYKWENMWVFDDGNVGLVKSHS